jgi:Ca-activated chloride channel family protein
MGDAIAWAIDDLQSAAPARKVVVLVSDGHNEPGVPGALDPIEAAALARSFGIVVHTIAIGESDPAGDISNRGPDVALLDHVARTSGGQSFVVNDVRRLENAFAQIDRLEKSPIEGEVQTRYREWRPLAAMLAAGCLTLGIVVRSIRKPILP